jgi:TonB family protein
MRTPLKKTLVTAAVALAAFGTATLGAAKPAAAAAPATASTHVAQGAAAPHVAPTWAVLHVDVSAVGDVEGVRLRYASGNRSFDRAALEAASRAVFVPTSHLNGPAGFDYLVLHDGRGHQERIVPTLAGYHDSKHAPVRVVTGDGAADSTLADSRSRRRP